MKAIKLLTACLLLLNLSLFAQTKQNAPKAVNATFTKMFAAAQNVYWSQTDGNWDAEFTIEDVDYYATFKADGTWLETKHQIDELDVPKLLIKALAKTVKSFDIEMIELSKNKNGTSYHFTVENDEGRFLVVIDEKGKVLKKEELMQVDDEDDDTDEGK